jgi:hypothetical protein
MARFSKVKLQMKREALVQLNRMANEQNVNHDLLRYSTSELMAKRRLRNGRNGPRVRKVTEVV